jgi:hypothetical protein
MGMTIRNLVPLLLSFSITACATEVPDESGVEEDLTANEVDSTYFSDRAMTHEVGEADLYCTGGHYQQGIITAPFVARFTWPCNGAGGHTVTCAEYVPPSSPGAKGSYQTIACPAGIF